MGQALISSGRPVVFGEVLYDCFPDGADVLGGAPFNVAWHLQGFGVQPLFVSQVGRDLRGERVLQTMEQWGMDRTAVQFDDRHPTGTVQVTFTDQGQPAFDVVPDQAYDFITSGAVTAALAGEAVPLLYRGTLAARSPGSQTTLETLVEHLGAPVFVDINLRAPWWTQTEVEASLRQARWAKLNDDELAMVTGGMIGSGGLEERGAQLRARYGLELLILTSGAAGACFIGAERVQQLAPPPLTELVDTVGAGDAFSAVTILGLLRDWPLEKTLSRALGFAAAICRQRGATAADRALYERCREQWND